MMQDCLNGHRWTTNTSGQNKGLFSVLPAFRSYMCDFWTDVTEGIVDGVDTRYFSLSHILKYMNFTTFIEINFRLIC